MGTGSSTRASKSATTATWWTDDICANDCTSNGIFYFADVQNGVLDQQICDDWNTFRASLSGFQFSRIAMWGSDDQVGKECTGNQADQLCQALEAGQELLNVNCDGNVWSVRTNCASSVELVADGFPCNCTSQYSLRPCGTVTVRGAISGNSCNTPTQTWEVVCQ